ncbi:hypothetical protein [Wolbachia endosymbiont of Folsomia candida]|uniref:hypothetical protein n=1 Tax=Wolbachia endosymbiont of Folsomia candida TaxID=169402 RepID=UPI000A66F1DA|nr:hypothetical protein [Wolbachia endosymbiont of Folsomia candida]APR97761.1 hypothetical protein ASM33_00160 [Wolbachia endosymbiont of Folsomia candida]
MCSQVLKCRISTYSDYKHEGYWLNIFRGEIDSNQDIDSELENGGEQAKHVFTLHYTNLLLYAIANKKTASADSIFTYINGKNNNGNLRKSFFFACDTYFKNDKYKGDAYRIITFLKEKNILKDFLKEYLNDKISEELSRKDEETNQYLYADKVIFSALLTKHKISTRKFNFIITCPISLMLTLLVLMISLPIGHIIYPDLSISGIFTQPLVLFSLCAILSLLFVGIAGSIWMHYAENNIPVEKMQQKLDAEKNSQGNASSEEQKVEELTPTTVLEIHIRPEPSYADTSFGDAAVTGCCLGMVLGSALS